ncbi:type IA DNA topoisomerase [Elizabethkingia anophelis]|uniref:DNA topoisomerase n=6 Tax=Elizabethkingia anophelis TaxID=1117645 RepID=A0A455ZFJ2_9FLAO|nr:type IA DNA topoisomerase [Elizabethkingia anophelis]ATC35574.1 type IA DNA topoisomerase [Elizabethkingia anophelis R26]ATC39212.1 type IA DNA topoisomerase [Elizabethkingia anophelis Ag1]ATC42893.1 type IA DNA topoisomerase [Elizabethkingia anophelis]ATC46569.1 type IA DNA topoisomerase [Elizabethkingia anophelis]KMU60586.1 DNA topoisomerase III [Elizabethkingia anophelis]
MITIIAEKPSVARDIAKVLGANTQKEGYLEGNGYFVTYAFGHLVGLAEPVDYGYSEKWLKSELPLVPESFKLVANKEAKKQLGIIKNLIKNSNSLIVATDAGREGELIFRWIYNFIGIQKPFKRLWISDMTDKSIKEGFNNLLSGNSKDNLYFSAKARAESDWLIGMNATRLMTLNNNILLSIGRVQTPTLRLIVDRYLDHKNFVTKDFWKQFIVVDNNNPDQQLKLACDIEFENEEKIQKYVYNLKNLTNCIVRREDKKEREAAPKLYSLTSLQKDANSKLNFTADETLKVLQGLYEKHKLVTYPRTDSEYLTDNQIGDVQNVLRSHKLYFSEINVISDISNNSAFNNAKVTDHHAVIPTNIVPDNNILSRLSEKERNLYDLVITRFFQRFSPDCQKEKVVLTTNLEGESFTYSQTTEVYKGWKIYNVEKDDKITFPILIKDQDKKIILEHSYSKHQTQPKKIHTEASLLSAMETAGKEIENEDLKEQMKGKGLGTPATRSGIIEILIKRSFIIRKGKQLIPTTTGIDLIEKVRDHKISIPEWTAEQEYELYKVEMGENSYSDYIDNIKNTVRNIIQELDGIKIEKQSVESKIIGSCPKCQKGNVIEGKKGYGCTEYKRGCDFVIWKEKASKKLSASIVKTLIEKRKTKKLDGFISKAQNKFSASLILNNDFKVEFDFN